MPQFSYTGLQAGKKISGAIVANDRIDAGKKLKNQKIIPTSLNQVKNDDSDADPEIKTFLKILENLFIKNLVLKLSEPSIISS